MMRTAQLARVCGLLAVLALSACAPGMDGGDDVGGGGGKGDDPNGDTINGEAAADYYARFLYRHDANKPLPYRFMGQPDAFRVGADFVEVDVYLQADHSFSFTSMAGAMQPDGSVYFPEEPSVGRGTWQVVGTRLVLEGLGEGTGATLNGSPGVLIRFDRDLSGVPTTGAVSGFVAMHSSYAPAP